MLKEQYEFIIYSLGKTDYLYDDFERTWEENEYEENKRHLSQTGWVNFSDNFFFFENDKLTRKKPYPSALLNQVDFNNSFEIWLKNKGVNWINSLWQGFIKQCSIAYLLERIAALQQNGTTGLDANKFLKNVKFTDFEQTDPRNEYFRNPPAYAKYLRLEALYATYKRKKYMIQFSQDICREDGELMEIISFGTYDNELESYCVGCEEVFDFFVESWVQEIFKEFFNRYYAQFMEEVKTAFISFPKDGKIVLFSNLVNRKNNN